MSDESVRRILEWGMPRYTQRTLDSPAAFFEDLGRVRERGFALDEQEFEEGISAVAAPILDINRRPIAAVAIAGPAYRLAREQLLEIGPSVLAAARDITREIGMAAYLGERLDRDLRVAATTWK